MITVGPQKFRLNKFYRITITTVLARLILRQTRFLIVSWIVVHWSILDIVLLKTTTTWWYHSYETRLFFFVSQLLGLFFYSLWWDYLEKGIDTKICISKSMNHHLINVLARTLELVLAFNIWSNLKPYQPIIVNPNISSSLLLNPSINNDVSINSFFGPPTM